MLNNCLGELDIHVFSLAFGTVVYIPDVVSFTRIIKIYM